MEKVVNIKPGEVFALLAAGRDVYAFDVLAENVINMRYQPVYSILDMIEAGERTLFIVEEVEKA